MFTARRLLFIAWVLLAALGGCGGGGGGADSGTAPSAPLVVMGTLSTLDAEGRIADASTGQTVELVSVDAQGTVLGSLASTQTVAGGAFRLELPRQQVPGVGLAITASNGAGGSWRALVLQQAVDLGPASEAFTQEFLAARAARGAPFTEPLERLARLQHNATLMLRLLPAGRAPSAEPIAALRDWLMLDPAASAALQSLRTSGALRASLGDIGGLMGVARGAREFSEASGGTSTVVVVPVPGSSTDWEATDTPTGSAPEQPTRLRMEGDGVTSLFTPATDAGSLALLELIGPHQVASFSLDTSATRRLATVDRPTTGYDFDGDGREDQLHYQVDQTVQGRATIEVFGSPLLALRVDSRTELRLTMSASGRTVSVTETRSQWSVPFIGPVRSDSTINTVDQNGKSETFTLQRLVKRAVLNDVSWPGRVRLNVADAKVPSSYMFAGPIASTGPLQLVFGGLVSDGTCCVLDNGLSTRDLLGQQASRDIVVPHRSMPSRVFASPDGSRIYVALNNELPRTDFGGVYAMAPADAAGYGATIVRYNALTLQEEARVVLPPLASSLAPGMAFPRNNVFQIVVSPNDPTEFAVTTFDALIVRGTTVLPQALGMPDSERAPGIDGKVRILDNQVVLRGWDGARNELWLELNGGGPLGRILPVSANGLRAQDLRPGLPVLFTLIGSVDLETYDRIDTDRAYLQGYRTVVDTSTGTVLRRISESDDFALRISLCAPRSGGVVCSSADTIYLLDKNLSEQQRLSLQSDLRGLSKGPVAPGALQRLFSPADSELIYMGGQTLTRIRY